MTSVVLATVLLGFFFLHAFYRAAEVQWPDSYYAIGRELDRRISARLFGYLLFRFGPVILTAAFVAVVLRRAGEPVVWPTLVLCGLHACSTSGRALVALSRSGQIRSRPLVAATHLFVSVGIVGAGGIAAMVSSSFEDAIPANQEITTALWTALMASVLGAYLVKVTRQSGEDTYDALERSRRAIPEGVWFRAAETARTVGAEERLVQAFLLVENLQRPKWARRIEQVGGRLFKSATYGPLQVGGKSPLSDEDAIDVAIKQRFAGQRVPTSDLYGYETRDRHWLRLLALAYNPSEGYASDVEAAYFWLESPRRSTGLAASDDRAPDGLPTIEIHGIDRRDSQILITGSVTAFQARVHIAQTDGEGEVLTTDHKTASDSAPRRGTFSAAIDPVKGAVTVEISIAVLGQERMGTLSTQLVRIPVGVLATQDPPP